MGLVSLTELFNIFLIPWWCFFVMEFGSSNCEELHEMFLHILSVETSVGWWSKAATETHHSYPLFLRFITMVLKQSNGLEKEEIQTNLQNLLFTLQKRHFAFTTSAWGKQNQQQSNHELCHICSCELTQHSSIHLYVYMHYKRMWFC